ncbi:hypothetical protein ACKVMT_15805 [Halobacteriales archaeon Cl-PHB]
MPRRPIHVLTSFRLWLGLATGVFALWYAVFLFRFRVVALLVDATGVAHGVVSLVPRIDVWTARTAVGVVLSLGIPVTIVAFFVGFGLFHRQAGPAVDPAGDD